MWMPASSANTARSKRPSILLLGDSHGLAVHQAVERRRKQGLPSPVTVFRRDRKDTKSEEEKSRLHEARSHDWTWRGIAGIHVDDFLARVAEFGPNDVVLSALAGSDYVYFGLLEHPLPFDFYAPFASAAQRRGTHIVPYRALTDMFVQTLADRYRHLFAIRAATSARVVHLLSPPPLADDEFIAQSRAEVSARAGIPNLPVAPADLRLKFYLMQVRYLRKACTKRGIEVMMPPAEAMQSGFLDARYYGPDAHHANALYGELVLREVEKRFLTNAEPPDRRLAEIARPASATSPS